MTLQEPTFHMSATHGSPPVLSILIYKTLQQKARKVMDVSQYEPLLLSARQLARLSWVIHE